MSQTLIASANAAVQITTEASFRGRVMALYTMIFLGVTPFGAPLIGWVAEQFGARWSMAVGGIASILVAIEVALVGYFQLDIRLKRDTATGRLKLKVPQDDGASERQDSDSGDVSLSDQELAEEVLEETETKE